MKILVLGAGNIGRLYAARLARSHDVTVLARGLRLEQLRSKGIQLEDATSGERTTTWVRVAAHLEVDDAYDLVMVTLPRHRVDEVLPMLAANKSTPNVLFFGNCAGSAALGRRALLGFPGAAAVVEDDATLFVILSGREQPTTIGEVDGRQSGRLERIAAAFVDAGFPVSSCPSMDAWLKTHVAEILPTVYAIYRARGNLAVLAGDDDAIRMTIGAIREGFAVLNANQVPITPTIHNLFRWLPASILVRIMRRKLQAKEARIKLGHAMESNAEWDMLTREFASLTKGSGLSTPCIDALRHDFEDAVQSLASTEPRSASRALA